MELADETQAVLLALGEQDADDVQAAGNDVVHVVTRGVQGHLVHGHGRDEGVAAHPLERRRWAVCPGPRQFLATVTAVMLASWAVATFVSGFLAQVSGAMY